VSATACASKAGARIVIDRIKTFRAALVFAPMEVRGRQLRRTREEGREFAMNWDVIKGNWKQFKGSVREHWGILTDDQLDIIAGKRETLSGKIQEAYGITKDEAEKQVKAFEERHKDYRPSISA
jgi:uncharacterized protein YjbJ (UPF0337 family)